MASFTELIKSGKIRQAYLQRHATIDEISQKILSIKALDQENPSSGTFNRLETNANKSLEELKVANRDLEIQLYNINPNINDDESYIADKNLVRDKEFSLFNAMEDYIKLLHSKEISYPPEAKPVTSSGDLAAILNNLVASQDKNALAQDKIITTLDKNLTAVVKSQTSNSRSGPKAAQPKFKSKNNDSDYGEFNDFLSKFEFFTAKCSTDVEKLQWLKTSVEGDAAGLIKHLYLSNEDLEIALNRFKARYSNPDVVKHSVL